MVNGPTVNCKVIRKVSRHLDGARHNVVVIGGGQAGLSMSYCLGLRGIDHLVLDEATVGNEWRDRRWDSFCLVTPNWQCALPGFPYQGPEPHGFMLRDEIVSYLESYARSFGPPLAEPHHRDPADPAAPRRFRDPYQPRHDHRGPGGGGHRSVPGAADAAAGTAAAG